jgi:cell division protein FtsQ
MRRIKEYMIVLKGSTTFPLIMLVVLLGLAGFASRKNSQTTVEELNIRIHNLLGNHYVDEADIKEVLSFKDQMVIGEPLGEIDFKKIENAMLSNPYISQAEVFGNFSGTVNLEVWLRKPLIRVINEKGNSVYVSHDAKVLPLSEKYNSRALLITGPGTNEMDTDGFWEGEYGEELFKMVGFIFENPFWKAQVSQMKIGKDGDILILPQVTKQQIKFGKPYNFGEKFEKLQVFYDRILPLKGWNYYTEVNLMYQDQIICY